VFGLAVLVFSDRHAVLVRQISLVGAVLGLAASLPLYAGFNTQTSAMQFVELSRWIPRFNVNYNLGVDGISVLFILLNSFITVLVVLAGWESIKQRVAQYMAAFLIMSGLLNGVFAALDALGQTDRALGDYSEAIRLDPKDPLAFLGRGVLFAGRQRLYERAVDDFDKVLVLAPNNVDGLMHRGDAYSQMGKFGPALADLDRAVALAPDNAEAYVYRGLANSRRNESRLAMFDYKAGLVLDPDNVDALVNLAAIYSTNGEQALAIADLDAAIALKKDDPLAFYNRGYAHFANRQYDLAAADYSSAIVLDPNMGLAYTNRCLIRTIVGKDLVAETWALPLG